MKLDTALFALRRLFVFVLIAFAGCGPTSRVDGASVAVSAAALPALSPELDFGAVVRNAHFGFRAVDGDFEWESDACTVRATRQGFSFTARVHGESSTIRFGSTVFSRGSSLPVDSSPFALGSDLHLSARRAEGITEHLANAESGTEQSWTLARAPEGHGPLQVRVPVSGLRYERATANGLHFSGPNGVRVRYGHATLVDARGARTRIEAKWDRDAIVITVAESLLDRAAFPLTIDPIVSAESDVDDPVYSSSTVQSWSVASGGGTFLLVSQDNRVFGTVVLATRITSAGVVLDPSGIPIAPDTNAQFTPSVAFDGTNFVVVWADRRLGSASVAIYAARVSPTSGLLDKGGIAITTPSGARKTPTVASNGSATLIAWDDNADIRAVRVDGSLGVLGSVFDVCACAGSQSSPAATWDGSQYLVVWSDYRSSARIYGARVSSSGVVADAGGFLIGGGTTTEQLPAVASGGGKSFVVWQEAASGISGARVDASGAVLDATPVTIANDPATATTSPDVTFDGTNFLVVWEERVSGAYTHTRAQRFDASAVAVDATPLDISSPLLHESLPAVTSDGTRSFVVTGPIGLRGRRIAGLTPIDKLSLAQESNLETTPAVAFDGTQSLVVWADDRGPYTEIYGARVGAGGVIDHTAIHIGANAASGVKYDMADPAVASNGSEFMVVWRFASSIVFARVDKTGALLDATPRTIASIGSAPAIASDGTNFYATWTAGTGSVVDVYGVPVSAGGTVLVANGLPISAGTPYEQHSSVAFGGGNYLVAWDDMRNGNADIYASRVSPLGDVLDTTGIRVTAVMTAQTRPTVAFGGGQFVVAWEDLRDGNSNIYASRISSAGVVTDPFGIAFATGSGDQTLPTAAFDGLDFMIGWQDHQTGLDTDVYAGRLSSAGIVRDPAGFHVADDVRDEGDPAMTGIQSGHLLVAFRKNTADGLEWGNRVHMRVITNVPLGTACTLATDCESGFCVDGVCCDTACGAGAADDCQACSVAKGAAKDGTCGAVSSGTVCRAATGTCDVAETCDGAGLSCPSDLHATDGTACDDGLVCNGVATCASGACAAGTALSCDDGDGCTTDSCEEPSGCKHVSIAGCADAGVDAPVEDSMPVDSSTAPDAEVDSAIAADVGDDTGTPDTALAEDTGSPDTAVVEDASGPTPTAAPAEDSGCGCSTAGRSRDAIAQALLASGLLLIAVRRRRA